MIEAIVPAAGLATRMRGLPKFLLPCDSRYTTLIENQVFGLLPYVDLVTIALRQDFEHLLDSLSLDRSKVRILTIKESSTMTETVETVANESHADQFVVVMPDTFFFGEQPFQQLCEPLTSSSMRLAIWKIREDQKGKLGQIDFDADLKLVMASQDKDPSCNFEWSWGAMSLKREVMNFSNPVMPHTGYLISALLEHGYAVEAFEVAGDYYDCGTAKEYFDLIGRIFHTRPSDN